MIKNPFPGPQPYRSSDRDRFYGREDIAQKLFAILLATRCVTVHGPSGAGKSSLVQAAVLPALIDSQDVRAVRVDGWPEGEDPARWLARSMFSELKLGDLPADLKPGEAVLAAVKRAARGSSRLVIIYLDQIEQLFYTGRTFEETDPFFACLQELVELPLRNVRVVLSLREDYLGRFRDRLRDRGRVLDNSFRVGPLTVAELTSAVCQAAAGGEPPQSWSADAMRALMLQVRLPGQAASDDAEAQSAYAQIVCRALFQQRAQGEAAEGDAVEAEPILRRYLETTLSDLGPLAGAAQRLLEDHLVTEDGSRTLRTEKELLRIVPAAELLPILKALEGAAILHAEEHQGSRYFEIGHDWLARKVFQQRQEREAQEEQRIREEERQRELEQQQKEAAERLAKARRQRRVLMLIAGASLSFAAVTSVLWVMARRAQRAAEVAQDDANRARVDAVRKRIEANDLRILAGFLGLSSRGAVAQAMKLLPEVKYPAERAGWLSYASDALSANSLRVTLQGHAAPIFAAVFSPDGKRAVTAGADGTARLWSAEGTSEPVILKGHSEAVRSAAFSPDGQRVLTTSDDGTARVWGVSGKDKPVELKGGAGPVLSGAFSPDGKQVLLGGHDGVARLYNADGSGAPIELGGPLGHTDAINVVAFFPDGLRVATASDDQTARVWTLSSKEPPTRLGTHKGPVKSLAISADGSKVVTTSHESLVRLFMIEGKIARSVQLFSCDKGEAVHAAISPDGALVAAACSDKRARIFAVNAKEQAPILLEGAGSGVTFVAFRPDGKFVAAASLDTIARVYPVTGGTRPLLLQGHAAALGSVVWSPNGELLLTAAEDERSADYTAKVWSAEGLKTLTTGALDAVPYHNASLSADGALIVATYDDKTARLRRVDGAGEPVVLKGHEGWIARAALSPKGDRVITAGLDKTARIWSADGKSEPVILAGQGGHTGDVRAAAFSPDGARVVTASEDKTAKVWSADSGAAPLATLSGHEDWLTCAAFSPDGARVVTASQDHTARVFNADGKAPPVVLSGHLGAVNSAAWSPDGARIVTASDDGTARVWRADGTGSPPIVLRGRGTGALLFAVWSADGRRVAASSSDRLVYVWSADGSDQPSVLKTAQPPVALAFVDKDETLLAVLTDNTRPRWKIDIKTLIELLKSAHADCVSSDIRAQYLDETAECAANAFELCESGYGRRSAPPKLVQCEEAPELAMVQKLLAVTETGIATDTKALAGPGSPQPGSGESGRALRALKDLGPDGRHVKVVVLPGDADVEIAGALTPRRDGVIELLGKKGDVFKLRVSKAGKYLEQDVTIEDGGAAPPLIDLNPKILGTGAGDEKKVAKPGQGNFSALVPRFDP